MTDLKSKVQGCLLGLAVGDALGGPTEGKKYEDVVKQFGRITDFISSDQAGSDDTEFAVLNVQLLLRHGDKLTSELIADAWLNEIAFDRTDFKGAGFSEVLAITNLRKGIRPPRSGIHFHSWSDGLAMRVAPYGLFYAGLPKEAARFAEMDGCVSHSGEGILAGKVVAAAISLLMADNPLDRSIHTALELIPEDSWTFRAIKEAIAMAEKSSDPWDAGPLLYESLACTYFPWADLAPEAVGLAIGLVIASRGNFEEAVLAGANIGRDADTIAAIAGALIGAQAGIKAIPKHWIKRVHILKGTCIPFKSEIDLIALSQQFYEHISALERLL